MTGKRLPKKGNTEPRIAELEAEVEKLSGLIKNIIRGADGLSIDIGHNLHCPDICIRCSIDAAREEK